MSRVLLSLIAAVAPLSCQQFQANNVKVLGDLNYGQSSDSVQCTAAGASYCAFVFNGLGDDRIKVTVNQSHGHAFVAIADGTLTSLISGSDQLVFTLPKSGPDPQAYYIVFRDRENKPGQFTVALQALGSK